MATANPLIASNPDRHNRPSQHASKATSLPRTASNSKEDGVSQRSSKITSLPNIASNSNEDHLAQNPPRATSLPTPSPADADTSIATAWDTIDPVTGLSNDYTTAISIIDSCDHAQLRRFNALLLADNPTLSLGQRIEMYYHHYRGIESEEEHGMGQGQGEGRRRRRSSVADKVAAVVAVWRGRRSGSGTVYPRPMTVVEKAGSTTNE